MTVQAYIQAHTGAYRPRARACRLRPEGPSPGQDPSVSISIAHGKHALEKQHVVYKKVYMLLCKLQVICLHPSKKLRIDET